MSEQAEQPQGHEQEIATKKFILNPGHTEFFLQKVGLISEAQNLDTMQPNSPQAEEIRKRFPLMDARTSGDANPEWTLEFSPAEIGDFLTRLPPAEQIALIHTMQQEAAQNNAESVLFIVERTLSQESSERKQELLVKAIDRLAREQENTSTALEVDIQIQESGQALLESGTLDKQQSEKLSELLEIIRRNIVFLTKAQLNIHELQEKVALASADNSSAPAN